MEQVTVVVAAVTVRVSMAMEVLSLVKIPGKGKVAQE
ncbi:hypothetical protein PR003_g26132 [Phytophthora rubi]|uniref:Uncharacterized protein n=1 Tax=Phytophthora rubi TaxID=129364 RepID=A0A6A4CB28_9STRA|nr:hypothetical protein PR003_g26132 [Phytophthora rubi]